MKLYVYCLVEGLDSLSRTRSGMDRAPVRLLKSGDFSVVVSDLAGDAVPVNRDNALAHASVIRSLLDETTPLPFRFGSIVSEQQLESYLNSHAEALQAKLNLIRGCVEMSTKIIWDREWPDESPAREQAPPDTPGTAFLTEKRRALLGNEVRASEATRVAAWLQERIGEAAKDTRISKNSTEKLLVAVSHLVERGSVAKYRRLVGAARDERPELHFLVSGPWAPYSFANIDLEFKSQFGVS
jgi:gas vesicle protein GvpL/GvpF